MAKTFSLAIEEAAKLHPSAEPLIVHAALLPPEPIPLFLFAEAREKFGEPLATGLADHGLDEAVAALRGFALLERERIVDEREPTIATDTIRLHRLVCQVAAGRRAGQARDSARRVLVKALAAVQPNSNEEVYNDAMTWPRWRRLDAAALALIGGDATPPNGAEDAAADLLNALAQYRHMALAAYASARPLYERALVIREKILGREHPDTAKSLNNFALLLQAQGDLSGARPLHERALAIREKAFGPDHPWTAVSLANLALLRIQAEGDLTGARPLYERALAICEKALGTDHPWTGTVLCNLAALLQEQGDLTGARLLYNRALAIHEMAGPENHRTATALDNLARLLTKVGLAEDAEPLFRRAIAIGEKVLVLSTYSLSVIEADSRVSSLISSAQLRHWLRPKLH